MAMNISQQELDKLLSKGNIQISQDLGSTKLKQAQSNTAIAIKKEMPLKSKLRAKSKYKNKKVIIDGITFDSTKEGNRYKELKLMEQAGEINDLKLQVKFELIPSVVLDGKKQRTVYYIADFTYIECVGYVTVEDTKGIKLPIYRLKRKLMKHIYGIEILET